MVPMMIDVVASFKSEYTNPKNTVLFLTFSLFSHTIEKEGEKREKWDDCLV